jgi:GT2 family glycosyltransferase
MDSSVRFSVVIPYFDRLPYLKRTLLALADQDIARDEFEIVISCLEYSPRLLDLLATLPGDLCVRCIMTRTHWNVSLARNMAFRQARGEILVLLDCDMMLPRSFLRSLRDRYFKLKIEQALIGQMLDYDAYTEVMEVELQDYEFYQNRYLSSDDRTGRRSDIRWTISRHIPWALCWTAVMAIPRSVVERHSLYFDTAFQGWGAEDLEWGFRITQSGIPIVFADDLWAMHLPHARNLALNVAQETHNLAIFLRKWPCLEVELVCAFGAVGANLRHNQLKRQWKGACPNGSQLGVVEFRAKGGSHLALGAVLDSHGQVLNSIDIPEFDPNAVSRSVPLWGLRLPYESGAIHSAYLLPSIFAASEEIHALIGTEARRVSRAVLDLSRR